MSWNEDETVARSGAARESGVQVTIDGERAVRVVGLTLLGRDPRAAVDEAGAALVALDDPARAMSKTHLGLIAHDGRLWAMDRRSVNGTVLRGPDGDAQLQPMQWVHVPPGSTVLFGDSRLAPATAISTGTIGAAASAWPPAGVPLRAVDAVPLPPIDRVPSAGEASAWAPNLPVSPGPVRTSSGAVAAVPAPLPTAECSACGHTLRTSDRFCEGCGAPVGVDVGAQRQRTAPTSGLQLPPPAGSATRGTRSRRRVAVACAAVLVMAGLALLAFPRSGDGSRGDSASGAPAVPEERPELQWTADVEGVTDALHADGAVFVGSVTQDEVGAEAMVARLDDGDGTEEWTTELDIDYADWVGASGVIDGTLIVDAAMGDHATIYGIDVATGDVLWDKGGWYVVVLDGRVYVVGDGFIERLDPESGASLGRVKPDAFDFTMDGAYIVAVEDGSEVTVHDARTMDAVVGPVDVDDDVMGGFGYDGSHIVVAVDDELRFFDSDGELVKTSALDVEVVYRILVVAPDDVVVYADETTFGITPSEPRAEERWSTSGYLGTTGRLPHAGSIPLVPVYRSGDGSATFVELDSGKRRLTVGDDGSREQLGRDAVVSVTFDERGVDDVTAYAYNDGEQLWALEPGADSAWAVDGGLVTGDDDGVAFYR